MAVIISGTTGITTPDITSDSYTGAVAVNASAPDNSLVVNSSGNVGIGASSPTNKLHVVGTAKIEGSTLDLNDAGTFTISQNTTSSALVIRTAASSYLRFDTNGAVERMRLDTNGSTFFNCTTTPTGNGTGAGSINVLNTSGDTFNVVCTNSGNNIFNLWSQGTSTNNMLAFFKGTSKTTVGNIVCTTSSTSYVTSSDYRLKEDWQVMTGASERVKALNPVNFAWKVDGSRVDGFLAHEAQAVVPEAVTGTKDAVDAEGNAKYQGIDQSKLVPLLTAALQEALAAIESLTTRITALEQA
tara:strand:- start:279 stop:1175 length:897 start_codon:yes stop_codon:yes gene_type:complete